MSTIGGTSRGSTRVVAAVVASVTGLLVAGIAGAQEVGEIRGRVVDGVTRTPLEGAVVLLLHEGTDPRTATTDADGTYRLTGLEEGLYRMRSTLRGYQTAQQPDVRVVRDRATVVDFELSPARAVSEEVVVAARASADDPRGPVTSFSYSREEIRRSPGTAGDVLRALDSVPGVAATGEFSAFSVRGRGPRDNLILVDGIPFDKVTHFDQSIGESEDVQGGGRFSVFAPNLIQELEFMPGGFPAAYGGKNGSLLKLTVAEGNRVTPAVTGRADITGWELGYDGPAGFHDDTSLLVSTRGQYFERLFELVGDGDIGAPVLYDLIVKSSSRLSPSHRLDVLGIYAPENYTRDVENVLASENFEDTSLVETEQDSALLGARWSWLFGGSGFVDNTFFFRYSDKSSVLGEAFPELVDDELPAPGDVPVRQEILDIAERETELGWRGDYNRTLGDWGLVQAGGRLSRSELDFSTRLQGDWIRYVYDQDDFRPDPSQRYIVLTPERVDSSFRESAGRGAAYVDTSLTVRERLTLTPGLRYDWDGLAGESLLSPRISASLALDPRTRLSLAGGVYYQYPRFLEVAADPSNLDLDNERSVQAVVGFSRYLRNDLRFSAEAYYHWMNDLIVEIDRVDGTVRNSGEGRSRGIDLGLVKRLGDRWYLQTAYSYQVAKRDDGLGGGTYDADFNRPHVFNVFLSWEVNDSWAVGGKWRYMKGRPTDDFIVWEDVFEDPDFLRFSKEITAKNVLRFPDFHTLNVRVDYRRRVGPIGLIAFVDFFNLYDHRNVDSLDWLERQGVNQEEGLEAFPTFGLKFEF